MKPDNILFRGDVDVQLVMIGGEETKEVDSDVVQTQGGAVLFVHVPDVECLLCDFGLVVDVLGGESWTANNKKEISSSSYRAPEAVSFPDQSNRLSYKLDTWALGCILFEAFSGASLQHVGLDEALRNMPVYRSSSAEDNKADLAAFLSLLSSLLEPDPELRLSSTELLAHPFLQQARVSSVQ